MGSDVLSEYLGLSQSNDLKSKLQMMTMVETHDS